MNGYDSEQDLDSFPEVRVLTKPQRRVLGVLVEKAYTVPESYPLTIKSVVSGSNQKSNRLPVTNYNEDALIQTLEDLQGMGLIAIVHTESGRTERYRHYLRKRYPLTEPQIAILAELWLRGRQQMGELRARASRMVPIESLQDLKSEVEVLLEKGFVQVNGSLERRGVEIDHNFYPDSENMQMEFSISRESSSDASFRDEDSDQPHRSNMSSSANERHAANDFSSDQITSFVKANEAEVQTLKDENQQLREDLDLLRIKVEDIESDLRQLRESLGA